MGRFSTQRRPQEAKKEQSRAQIAPHITTGPGRSVEPSTLPCALSHPSLDTIPPWEGRGSADMRYMHAKNKRGRRRKCAPKSPQIRRKIRCRVIFEINRLMSVQGLFPIESTNSANEKGDFNREGAAWSSRHGGAPCKRCPSPITLHQGGLGGAAPAPSLHLLGLWAPPAGRKTVPAAGA